MRHARRVLDQFLFSLMSYRLNAMQRWRLQSGKPRRHHGIRTLNSDTLRAYDHDHLQDHNPNTYSICTRKCIFTRIRKREIKRELLSASRGVLSRERPTTPPELRTLRQGRAFQVAPSILPHDGARSSIEDETLYEFFRVAPRLIGCTLNVTRAVPVKPM